MLYHCSWERALEAIQHNDYLEAAWLFAETASVITEGLSNNASVDDPKPNVGSINTEGPNKKGFAPWLPEELVKGLPKVEHISSLWGPFWLLCQLLYLGPEHCDVQRFRYASVQVVGNNQIITLIMSRKK